MDKALNDKPVFTKEDLHNAWLDGQESGIVYWPVQADMFEEYFKEWEETGFVNSKVLE